MKYEVNVDEMSTTIITLLEKTIDKNVKPFGTYDTAKIKMMMQTTYIISKIIYLYTRRLVDKIDISANIIVKKFQE